MIENSGNERKCLLSSLRLDRGALFMRDKFYTIDNNVCKCVYVYMYVGMYVCMHRWIDGLMDAYS